MKRYFATSILALLCTCLVGHAGTIATVSVTLQEGDKKPVVAEAKVDITDKVYLPLILPDRRVWICKVDVSYAGDQLRDSAFVTVTDSSKQISTSGGLQHLMLFSGQITGNFQAGDKVVVFRSGATTLELEIQPERKAGEQGGARQSATDPESKPEGKEKPKTESGASSR